VFDTVIDLIEARDHTALSLIEHVEGELTHVEAREARIVVILGAILIPPSLEARHAPRDEVQRMLRSHGNPLSLLPNGSRLSCGRNARRRKAVQRQKKKLAGEATQFFPTGERPAASSAC